MAKLAVVAAVEARISSWSSLPLCPLVGENGQSSPPKDGSPYLLLQFPFSDEERTTFGAPGSNVYREEGAFRLLVHVETGSGAEQGRQFADELETLFRGKQFGGVETFAPQSASSDDDNDNGQYFIYAVAVPYRFDFFG
jgi:hypothetical protein